MAHNAVQHRLEKLFAGSQLGVGVKGGAEILVCAVNVLFAEKGSQGERALLKVDFSIALNTVSREAFVEEVAREIPEISAWTRWCYQAPAHLWAGKDTLSSMRGTQQGDPLGPLFFSLVLRKVAQQLKQVRRDLDVNSRYLDDGVLVGKREDLQTALQHLASDEVRQLGLHLNLEKCQLWWPSGGQSFPGFPAAVRRIDPEGVLILKAPVGGDSFVQSVLEERAAVARKVADRQCLEDPHVAFALLRACLGSCTARA